MPPIAISKVVQKVFPINIIDLFEFYMMSNKIDESMIWHQQYGHLPFNTMKLLHTKNMVQ